jgi:hypothetical protein
MASQFGFCNTCGAPRNTGAAQFCASCGASLPALVGAAAPTAVPPPPPPTQAWGTPPPPPPQQPWASQQQAGWNTAQQQPQQNWATPPAPQQWAGAPAPAKGSGINPLVVVGAIILIVILAIGGMYALGGNKGGTASGSPAAGQTAKPGTTSGPAATTQGGNNGGSGLGGASSAFANINSFKFSMTLAGGTYGSMLSMFGGASGTGDVPFNMSGTITLKPVKAADIKMAGFHIVEIDGFDYIDMGLGSYFKSAVSGTSSMADSFSPATMFSSMVSASSSSEYNKVGTDSKNGVQADHYQATAAALGAFGSSLGVADATWTSDVWIATEGGYPVSFSVIATAADKSVAYEVAFDLTNVNDPSNTITAPTNVTGS